MAQVISQNVSINFRILDKIIATFDHYLLSAVSTITNTMNSFADLFLVINTQNTHIYP